jgi:hypothetical protein
MDMTPIYTPRSQSEASVIAALMNAHEIRYVMQGEAFSSMYPGPFSTGLNELILLVAHEDVELARQLIEPFTQNQNKP